MKDTNSFILLQYNVRNDRAGTIIPLLADSRIQDYNIIVIQELWHNPLAPTTPSSHQSGFYFLYCSGGNTRVCFYVNKAIDPESWEVSFLSPDICTLKIITQTKDSIQTIHIHNVYNPLPASYFSTKSPSTLLTIKDQLTMGVYHVLFSNFNLHHPFWNGLSRPIQHAAADQLLEIVDDTNFSLTLSKGRVTWEAKKSFNTINLIFMSEYLAKRLVHCMPRLELNQSSDYIPISTRILLDSKQQVTLKWQA